MRYPGFIGGFGQSASHLAGIERTVNFYLEQLPSQAAKNSLALYPAPGLKRFTQWLANDGGAGRALLEYNDVLYAVIGTTFVLVTEVGVINILGSAMQIDTHPAQMVSSGEGGGQMLVASGDKAYLYDFETLAFTVVVDQATQIGFLDGFFIRLDAITGTMAISGFYDGATWDALQFAQRDGSPDRWRAMIVNGGDIFLIGANTGDVWVNTGAYPFPFQPRPGITFEPGIAAPWSLQNVQGNVTWLSRASTGQGIVVQARGYTPQPISSTALTAAIQSYAVIEDAVGMTYQMAGHTFYQLTFPTANATWLYDQTMGVWTERGRWDGDRGDFVAWGPTHHAFCYSRHIVCGPVKTRPDGSVDPIVPAPLFEMSMAFPHDVDGAPMRRMRIAPGICAERKLLAYDRFELYADTGLGIIQSSPIDSAISVADGTDPQAMLRTSRDGGKTWDSGRWRSAGRQGAYGQPLLWNRCGSSRDMVFELTCSDPIPWRITDAFLTIRQGAT